MTSKEIHAGLIGELEDRAEHFQHLCGEPGHEGAVILFAVEMGSAVAALEGIGVQGEAVVGGQAVPIGRREA